MKAVKHGDAKAWVENPDYNFVYNKLWLCRCQGIDAAPVPIRPETYPVFYKPITNLYGLGAFSFRADSFVDKKLHSGLFWMEYLEGLHWTFNCFFRDGSIEEEIILTAQKDEDLFELWEPCRNFKVDWIENWLQEYVGDYEGPLNLEGIGEKILEVHLRESEQIQRMYPEGQDVFARGTDRFCVPIITDENIYSVDESLLQKVRSDFKNAKIVVTVENGEPELGISENRRIGYVICEDEDLGFEVKNKLLQEVFQEM